MNIIEINIANTKKIKVFNKVLDGKNLEIAGLPGTGKTTAISSLWDIMDKKHGTVTDGEKKGEILVKLASEDKTLIAKRINKAGSSTITIQDQNGKKVSTKDFQNMISELSVNPHDIMKMKPKEQTITLLKAAKVGIDLEAIDKEISELENERLMAYRVMENHKPGEQPEKVEKVDVTALFTEKDRLESENVKKTMAIKELSHMHRVGEIDRVALETLKESLASYEREIKKLKSEIDNQKSKIQKEENRANSLEKDIVGMPEYDISSINEQIESSQTINELAMNYNLWLERADQYERYKLDHQKVAKNVTEKENNRKNALETAKWPIEGLYIEDGNVVYKDHLLSNLGTSEQMLVCAAIALEDIKNHEIKVVRMDGIESMGETDFRALQKLFNKHNIQVLSSRVSRGDESPEEIVIEEGEYQEL